MQLRFADQKDGQPTVFIQPGRGVFDCTDFSAVALRRPKGWTPNGLPPSLKNMPPAYFLRIARKSQSAAHLAAARLRAHQIGGGSSLLGIPLPLSAPAPLRCCLLGRTSRPQPWLKTAHRAVFRAPRSMPARLGPATEEGQSVRCSSRRRFLYCRCRNREPRTAPDSNPTDVATATAQTNSNFPEQRIAVLTLPPALRIEPVHRLVKTGISWRG